jgi:hypothetical protein
MLPVPDHTGEVTSRHPSSDSVILSRPEFLLETRCFAKVAYETPLIERDSAHIHSSFFERPS